MKIEDTKSKLQIVPKDEAKIRQIWKTTIILLLITLGEFILAFTIDRGIILYTLYMLLTIWKAKYIMMEFMHLKEEVRILIYSIIIPLIFLIWLGIVLIKEGLVI